MQPNATPPTTTSLEIAWINNFLSTTTHISVDDIDSILYFSLIWNLFEGLVCNRYVSILALEQAVNKLQQRGKLNLADYDDCRDYLTRRYIEGGKVNHLFDRLRLRQDNIELVRDVLEGRETKDTQVLLAMLMIVYRYRNNLFHGEKSLQDLPGQTDNFRIANQLLMKFLERWKT